MRILNISAGYPPDLDGIGDYSWCLGKALAQHPEVTPPFEVYTRDGGIVAASGVQVFTDEGRRPPSLYEAVNLVNARRPDWILLHYNPFSWGRRGFCPSVSQNLKKMGRGSSRAKIAVMFHELFTEEVDWKSRLMKTWQQVFAKQVARAADVRITSCQAYAEWLTQRGWAATSLPVGSNLPDATAKPQRNPGRLNFGSFGSSHASRRMDLAAAAVAAVRDKGVDAHFVFIGSGGEKARGEFERLGVPFRATGAVNPNEAADEIADLDVFLAPFSDGLSGRRTSAIAALKAGVPLLSSAGRRTDVFLKQEHGKALLLAQTDEEFIYQATSLAHDTKLREKIGNGGKIFYAANLDWNVIASQLVMLLDKGNEK